MLAAEETGRPWWVGQLGKAGPLGGGIHLLDPIADGLGRCPAKVFQDCEGLGQTPLDVLAVGRCSPPGADGSGLQPGQDVGQKQSHDDGERARHAGQAHVQGRDFGEQEEGDVIGVLVKPPYSGSFSPPAVSVPEAFDGGFDSWKTCVSLEWSAKYNGEDFFFPTVRWQYWERIAR